MKILVVDDDESFLYMMERICRKISSKIHFHGESNGKAAIDFLEQFVVENGTVPDLCLVDINMPIMTGPEMINELALRRDNGFPLEQMYIIVMTSSENENEKSLIMDSGVVSDYRLKPIGIEDLKLLVQDFYEEQSSE
jgi:CheY-like chemotaxis protein